MVMHPDSTQERVLTFLSQAESYNAAGVVEVIKTHCAYVFLIGDDVYKVKRAVSFSYLDMSTLDARYQLCVREIELNRLTLPDIYLSVVPVTETQEGCFQIGGDGKPVEWAIHMRRFPEAQVLDRMASAGQLGNELAASIGCSIADYHAALPAMVVFDGYERIREVVDELLMELGQLSDVFLPATLDELKKQYNGELQHCRQLLNERACTGYIKRCHGDLHLRNLVMHNGVPTPFDALEFDERMASTDVLYDLAFLIMDLNHRNLTEQANAALNQYLLHSSEDNLKGMRLLPLFLACRACIRAMTTAQAMATVPEDSHSLIQEATAYMQSCQRYLERRSPIMIAIGGLSGTGKSTLARRLSPIVGNEPGAVLLRSDAERKAAENVAETATLPDEHYTHSASLRNYELLRRKAEFALDAGCCVIVDAVFLEASQRESVEQCARQYGCRFIGFWLTADTPTLEERVGSRVNDASDATISVLHKQLLLDHGEVNWHVVSTIGSPDDVFAAVVRQLTANDVIICPQKDEELTFIDRDQ